MVGIVISQDMNWNKIATGKVYDSFSEHGFVIGCRTINAVGYGVS